MHKFQHKNTSYIKNQGNITYTKITNSIVMASSESELDETLDNKLK